MFHDVYTKANNETKGPLKDPLNLKFCLRLYPHDDNQGGFFVAVLKRVENDDAKLSGEDLADPWLNTKIKEEPILDQLAEFSNWYEKLYKEHCELNNIPEAERTKLGMCEMIELAKQKEKDENEALGIPCGNLSKMKKQK